MTEHARYMQMCALREILEAAEDLARTLNLDDPHVGTRLSNEVCVVKKQEKKLLTELRNKDISL